MTDVPTRAEYQQAAQIRSAIRAFLRSSERVARRHGLTPQRHLLLLMIKGAPDGSERSTVTELAGRLHLAQSTVTELVARADVAGLLTRRVAPRDGRVTHLSVSREGERMLAAAVAELGAERRRLLELLYEVLPPDER